MIEVYRLQSPATRRALLWMVAVAMCAALALVSNGAITIGAGALQKSRIHTAAPTVVLQAPPSDNIACRTEDIPSTAFVCNAVNIFSDVASFVAPGVSVSVDTTFTNAGGVYAPSFHLTGVSCSALSLRGTDSAINLCGDGGGVTLNIRCAPGGSFIPSRAWADMTYIGPVQPDRAVSHTAKGKELGVGDTWTCRQLIAISPDAPAAIRSMQIDIDLQWTLQGYQQD